MMKNILAILGIILVQNFAIAGTSYTTCGATAQCYDSYGYYINNVSCHVYGSSTVYGNGNTSSSCNWRAVNNVGVTCNGFTQMMLPNGTWGYGWQNISVTCNDLRAATGRY